MSGPFRGVVAIEEVGAHAFVTRALAQLEGEFRALALVALADWEAAGIVEGELFAALGALARPSWGTWSFLLQSLRNARKAQLRKGRRVEGAAALTAVLAYLDVAASHELVEAIAPLVDYLGGKAKVRRIGDALVAPIALRNQVAHFPPTDETGWETIRAALAPLVAWHVAHPIELAAEAREPWFVVEDDVVWSLGGIEKDFAIAYASPQSSRPRLDRDRGGAVARALQAMLGKSEQQEQSFHRLLGQLAPDEIRGVVIGDFLVGAPVAKGGFATVHVGRQLSTGRKVAMKLLADSFSEDARARFQQEAAYLSRIQHPAVVGVINYGEDAWTVPRLVDLSGEPWFGEFSRASIKSYIALEWIEGRTLEDVFRAIHVDRTEPRPPLAELRRWFRDAARALTAVHAAGMIHRDLKPSNLMLTPDGDIRLMDFGIARSDDENRTLLTSVGFALGTPPYMSPEQLRAHDADAEVGPASDVYSLCATFYELITGHRLYTHDRETADTVRTKKLRGELPAAPRALVDSLPWELEVILIGGLHPEVTDRYRSAAALVGDLERWEADEPIAYRRPTVLRRATLAYRRHRAISNLGVAFALLASSGLAYYVHSINERNDRITEQFDRAEAQTKEAQDKLARLYEEQGRIELLAGRSDRALPYLAAAYELGSRPSLRFLLVRALPELVVKRRLTILPDVEIEVFALSADGERVVLRRWMAPEAEQWDTRTGTLIRTFPLATKYYVDFVIESDFLTIIEGAGSPTVGRTTLYDLQSGALLSQHEEFSLPSRIRSSPDHCGDDKTLARARDTHTGRIGAIVCGATRLVTPAVDATRVWDLASGELLATIPIAVARGRIHNDPIAPHVAVANREQTIALQGEKGVEVWDVPPHGFIETENAPHTVEAPSSTDTVEVASSTDTDGGVTYKATTVYDFEDDEISDADEDVHTPLLEHAIAISPDETRVATPKRIFDVATGNQLAYLEHAGATIVFWRDDGTLVTVGADTKRWDPAGKLLETRPDKLAAPNQTPRHAVSVTEDRRRATVEDTHATLDSTMSPLTHAPGFDVTGDRAITTHEDHAIRIWDATSGALLATLRGHGGVTNAFASSARYLVVRELHYDELRIWTFGTDPGPAAAVKARLHDLAWELVDGRLQAR